MKRRVAGLCLALGLALGLAGAAGAEAPLRVYAEDYPPYAYSTAQGPAGLHVRRVQALLARAGIQAEIEFLPWARAYELAQGGDRVLIFAMQRTPEREANWLWLAELSAEPNYLYRLAKRRELAGLSLADMPRYRISVIRRSATAELLRKLGMPQRNLEEVTDMAQNLHKLVIGRVDFIAGQEESLRTVAKELGLPPERYTPALQLNAQASLYLTANLGFDPVLRQRLEQALAALRADGSWERLGH